MDAQQKYNLLPFPRRIEWTGGIFQVPEHGLIALDGPDIQASLPTARKLQVLLQEQAGLSWELVAGAGLPPEQIPLALKVIPGSVAHEQGYRLTISPQRIDAVARTACGLFYAVQTICQLFRQGGKALPTLIISDQPAFTNRGVMLDISRDKVPSMETLYGLVDLLASWKINQLQLYIEHTFAYRNHPVVWANASPMTGEEILALDAYCRERFIELVPNQATFGHMRRWLIHKEYIHLAECPEGCDTRWGRFDLPYSLAPLHPGSLELVRSLLDELLPHFSSQQVNIGGDETVDLDRGQGRSGEQIKKYGVGRVYMDYIMKVYREVKARRHTMQIWGDVIMEHPELVPELPHDVIAMEWGYEADHPFDDHGGRYAASGVPFYVCPGTSSWNTVAGRTENAIGNLRNAALNGLKHAAVGYLITDWGDNSHWQPLPVSYLGFAYGAALAWDYQANLEVDIPPLLDLFAFQDSHGVMGQLAYELGNAYLSTGILMDNNTSLFNVLQSDFRTISQYLQNEGDLPGLEQRFQSTLERIDEIMRPLSKANMLRPDASLIISEFTWAARMLQHACRRVHWAIGQMKQENTSALQARLASEADELIEEYKTIWHARNRVGGFVDSVRAMEKMRDQYSQPS